MANSSDMQTLTKNGLLDDKSYGKMDDLTYEYNGNQVTKITDKVSGPYYKDAMHFVDGADAEIEYEYDKNGCMTKDLNKNISKIEYNLLNLPTKLSFEDGSIISYSYDADGTKLSADYNLSLMNVVKGMSSNNSQSAKGVKTHRDYCGNFIYEDGALKMLLFDGGYVTFYSNNSNNINTPQYHFYLKDHLGNNRVVADANGNIEQVNHYYPFGGLMAESTGEVQPYKYNGKELERIHGLDSYDYGARWMSDGRFTTQDPHAKDYVGVSPYAYCGNNPILYADYDGMDVSLTGKDVETALASLSAAVGNGIQLLYNPETKYLCYKIIDKSKITDNALSVIKVIDNCDVNVELRTITNNKYNGKAIIGGAYFGANYDEKYNSARSLNVINPKVLDKADTYSEKGKSIMHELTESYFGATNAYSNKKSYPASYLEGTNYWNAHKNATPQNEIFFYEYDKNGKKTKYKKEAVGQNIYVTNGKQTTTILDWNYEKYGRIE